MASGPDSFERALAELRKAGHPPGVAILDGVLTSDGIIDLDAGLVQELVRVTRQAGALWVADEENHRIVRFCCPAVPEAPAPGGDGEPAPTPGGGSGSADTTAPLIKLSGRRLQPTRAARRRGLSVRVATSERATVTMRALVSKRTARRLGLRTTSIGRATANLEGPGTSGLRVRLSAGARRALLRAPRVRIVIRATAADPAGNRSSASLAITARR
jgi:hypothetical protein